jgi:Glycosyl transferases group 1
MRRDFCTILNLPFLLKGIVLYRSLARVAPGMRLYVACMDEESESLLEEMQLSGLVTVSEAELLAYDAPLAELRSRPIADYCKSMKPSLCRYVLDQGSDLVTFLDADLMFFSDPEPMFDELGEGSILLMPMRRGPRLREEKDEKFGRYNSGTVSFRGDDTGLEALGWWRSKCLEGRLDENPLLDQPFIKDWPERFTGVHVVEHLGCGVAPWNAYQYEMEPGDRGPEVNGVPLVFYHYFGFAAFHSVNAFHRTGFLREPRRFLDGQLSLSWERHLIDGAADGEDELVWIPYVREFAAALAGVRGLDPTFTAGLVDAGPPRREAERSGVGARPGDEAAERTEGAVAYPAVRASGHILQPVWRHPDKDERSEVRVTEEGDLLVDLGLPASEWFYVFHGATGFQEPPADPDLWAVEPGTFYELAFEASIEGEELAVRLFAIEYDDRVRLGHQVLSVEEGVNALRLTTSPLTESMRIAIRFSGSGRVRLSPIRLSNPSPPETDELLRATQEAATLRSELAAKDVTLSRTESELAALTGRIQSLQSSSSYRLMRALWRIKAAIRRSLGRIRQALSRGKQAKVELEGRVQDRAVPKTPLRPSRERQVSGRADPVSGAPARSAARVEVDAERRRWLARSGPPEGPGGLRVAAVMDEISWACFDPECELIGFGAEDWRETLAERQPHLLLVESCWRGNGGSWQYQVATYEHPDYAGLPNLKALLEWCREREIPTVFWNKEDPFHFDRFSEAAVLFDHLLTTDRNCIPRYQALEGRRAKTIEALPFAAQPQMHNPIAPPGQRSDSLCFAGAYYRDRHVDRRHSLEMLLDAARPYGLVIYDRTFGTEDKAFGFPERFSSHIRKRLSYEEMVIAYKRHKLFLNVNSVADSPTMFSRRVFELAACDTAVLSTESLGIADTFGGLVPMVETPDEAAAAIERLLGDEAYRRRVVIPARRLVLSEHTYRRRIAQIGAIAGYEVSPDAGEDFAVLVLVDDVDQARGLRSLVASISEQTTLPAEFLIGVGAQTSVAGDVQRLSDAAAELRVRVTEQDANTSRRERFRELARIAASPWVAVVHTAHAYGQHHFTDLLACTRFASADVIGAAAFATTSGEIINAGLEHRFADFLHPHSALAERGVIAKRGWPDEMPSAWATLNDWRQEGVRYYSGDRDNFKADSALGLPPPQVDLPADLARASR